MHADRRDLARRAREPDPGEAVDPLGVEPDRGERADERLLEIADVALDVLSVPAQIEDRVGDELARAVERRLAAPVGLDDLDGGVVGNVQLSLRSPPTQRDDRRMLEQQDRVGDRALRDRTGE